MGKKKRRKKQKKRKKSKCWNVDTNILRKKYVKKNENHLTNFPSKIKNNNNNNFSHVNRMQWAYTPDYIKKL